MDRRSKGYGFREFAKLIPDGRNLSFAGFEAAGGRGVRMAAMSGPHCQHTTLLICWHLELPSSRGIETASSGCLRVLQVWGTWRFSMTSFCRKYLRAVFWTSPPSLHSYDGSSLVALENELGELGSFNHNPQLHTKPQPAISTPNHPGKPPHQGAVLIVVAHPDPALLFHTLLKTPSPHPESTFGHASGDAAY